MLLLLLLVHLLLLLKLWIYQISRNWRFTLLLAATLGFDDFGDWSRIWIRRHIMRLLLVTGHIVGGEISLIPSLSIVRHRIHGRIKHLLKC